jgi:hypothetical protein
VSATVSVTAAGAFFLKVAGGTPARAIETTALPRNYVVKAFAV